MTLQQAIEDYGHIPLYFTNYDNQQFYFVGEEGHTMIAVCIVQELVGSLKKDEPHYLNTYGWAAGVLVTEEYGVFMW